MSTLKVNTLQNTSGVEVYTAKAWVNFNGTGTVAIRASGNVSSITDNGVGDYTVNFTAAMSDANYAVTTQSYSSGSGTFSSGIGSYNSNGIMNTTNCRIYTRYGTAELGLDINVISVVFHR